MTNIFFEEELKKEFESVGIKTKKPKVVYSKKHQSGKRIDFIADKKRKSLPPGKRISKSGKTYYEYRKNRSDYPDLGV